MRRVLSFGLLKSTMTDNVQDKWDNGILSSTNRLKLLVIGWMVDGFMWDLRTKLSTQDHGGSVKR